MTKKKTPKKYTRKNEKITYTHIVAITFVLAIVVLIGTLTIKAVSSPSVLGTTTGTPLLAQDNADQRGDSQGNAPQSDTNSPELHPSGTTSNQQQEQTAIQTHQSFETPQGHIEVQTEGNKGEFNLETPGTHVEIKKEDNGSLKITAHNADGTEIQLQNDALAKINESLKNKDISVGSTSAHGFSIKSGDVEAETHLPLTVNPTTKSLSITTPQGTEEISFLPNQVVQSLLQHQILSSVSQSTASGTATNAINLTQLNNHPVFSVAGATDKKLLGLFPVSFNKTVFVSAQTGQVLQTQQDFFSRLFEALSF